MTKEPESIFLSLLNELLVFENKSLKVYERFGKSCLTDELSKALHPEQTNLKNHIQRLKLIRKTLPKVTAAGSHFAVEIAPFKTGRIQTASRDMEIIRDASSIQAIKIANYELLLHLAKLFDMEHAPLLLEQCITENHDTLTWLKQITTNILAPQFV